jgi:DNA modification methylase
MKNNNVGVQSDKLSITYVPIDSLHHAEYNPRLYGEEQRKPVRESIQKHGLVDALVVNSALGREGTIVGGNLRWEIYKELGHVEVPVVYVNIPDLKMEQDLCLRLNKAVGDWSDELLKLLDEGLLADVGFTSEELDEIFSLGDSTPEMWSLEEELKKLDIKNIDTKKGDVYEFSDGSRLMNGDSCIEADMLKLMDGNKADLCLTDPPYILDYLKGKTKNKDGVTRGFGAKKNRVYLGTETLPENFTDLWMANIAKIQKPDFSIIIFEHPKNLRTIWNALEKYWRYRATITWHVPNRMQNFSGKYKFFNKQDIALVGTGGEVKLNLEEEDELFQNEYDNALYATSGKPHWESYEKGKKICPTDFISHIAADKKSSGQEIIFGTKPLELLIPYMKVLTKRGDLVVEPFGGSGSTGAAAIKLGRKFRMIEKSEIYTEVIKRRIELLLGTKAKKL